jgi:hypothetical protein
VRFGKIGRDLKTFLVEIDGFLEISPHGIGQAQGIQRLVVAGIEAQGLVEILNGLVDIIAVEIKQSDIVLVLGIFFLRLLRFFLGRGA